MDIEKKKKGLARCLKISCISCEHSHDFYTSPQVNTSKDMSNETEGYENNGDKHTCCLWIPTHWSRVFLNNKALWILEYATADA